MTNKTDTKLPAKSTRAKTSTSDKNEIALEAKTKADKTKRMDEIAVSANLLNASLALPFYDNIVNDVKLLNILNGLKQQITDVQAGDMASIEAMLVAQANSLQTMFVSLGRKAVNSSMLPQYTAFMNLALKAQSQSRATIQALTELKYPKQATYVKQANIANGNQQVNNGQASNETSKRAPAHARESTNQPNELIEVNNGSETLDGRATQTAILKDKSMATVAAQHRG